MEYIENYLYTLVNNYHQYDDCRKALILHRLYISFEKTFENFLRKNSLYLPEKPGRFHKDLVFKICDYLNLSSEIHITLDDLRRFRHVFANNYSIIHFDEERLDSIYSRIETNFEELIAIVNEVNYVRG